MKKNISWQVLIAIGLIGNITGRFIIIGVVGHAIGLIGDICLLIGIVNMIVTLVKNRKLKKGKKEKFIKKSTIEIKKVDTDKNLEENRDIDFKERFVKYTPFAIIIILIIIIAIFINNKNDLKNITSDQPEQSKKELLFQKQTECMQICKNIYENHKKLLLTIGTVFPPKYAYNEDKNACFYSGGWVDSTASITKVVINCQTNQEVLTFEVDKNDKVFRNCDTCVISSEEYTRREKEYMGNDN